MALSLLAGSLVFLNQEDSGRATRAAQLDSEAGALARSVPGQMRGKEPRTTQITNEPLRESGPDKTWPAN